MKLLVSACLLGVACRYDGRSKLHPLAQELCRRHEVIPVCGEIFGGLPTPRLPSERREGIPVLGESRMGELLTEGEACLVKITRDPAKKL